MPANPSINDLLGELVQQLCVRAVQDHRSLEDQPPAGIADAVRTGPPLSSDEVLAEVRRRGLGTPAEAATIVRADPDRR